LTTDEARRLLNACGEAFREIVEAALLTGARYGELAAMTASDFNPDSGTVHIRTSKAGKTRHVVLNDEGRALFECLTTGRAGDHRIFTKADGTTWGKSHQHRPLKAACERAKIGRLSTSIRCGIHGPVCQSWPARLCSSSRRISGTRTRAWSSDITATWRNPSSPKRFGGRRRRSARTAPTAWCRLHPRGSL
jgi:hypothetical protein